MPKDSCELSGRGARLTYLTRDVRGAGKGQARAPGTPGAGWDGVEEVVSRGLGSEDTAELLPSGEETVAPLQGLEDLKQEKKRAAPTIPS